MNSVINNNYLSWDEAFIALAKLISKRSRANYAKEGSCIVDSKNRIMSLGYNGLPQNCDNELFPKIDSDDIFNSQKTYVLPSINNAILLARRNLDGCTLYTTSFPNSESVKMILQRGIRKIYYSDDLIIDEDDYRSSSKMLISAGIEVHNNKDVNVICDKNYLTWNEIFIALGKVIAMRSKDPSTQVGCCIADAENRIISLGYNGLPAGCDDRYFPWTRDGASKSETKYPYVVHSEANAIHIAQSTSPINMNNSSIYVTLFPCKDCAMAIIQVGIKKVYYVSDKYKDLPEFMASKRMFDAAGISYEQVTDVNVTVETSQKVLTR